MLRRQEVLGHYSVILAAGSGTRMKSGLPKVLHPLWGKPMLGYVIEASGKLSPDKTVVVIGKGHDKIRDAFAAKGMAFALQKKANGTADALASALPALDGPKGTVLVLNGDMPLIRAETLKKFLGLHRKNKNSLSVASFFAGGPHSYGRILRDRRGHALRIVEALDADEELKRSNEVNSGLYAIEPSALSLVKKIRKNALKGEYYLTDLLALAVGAGLRTGVYPLSEESEFMGVNTRQDLLLAQETMRRRSVCSLMEKGVVFMDASSAFIHPGVSVGAGTVVYPNVYIEGSTEIGRGCTIYPNSRITDSKIKDRAVVKDSSLIEESVIGKDAQVGPFAHLRPGSAIGDSARIGNFVEIKKSTIGKGTKAMHLTYIGDAEVGSGANIGAGTITCNYDGSKKHKTVIEDGVFVGSDTQIVAPVRIKKGAYIGAGSTITGDVPAGSLALSRVRQRIIEGWAKAKDGSEIFKLAARKSRTKQMKKAEAK